MEFYRKEFNFFYKDLLDLINTPFGKSQLKIDKKEKIIKISPNSYHILKGFRNNKPLIEATFFTYVRVAQKLLPVISSSRIYRYAYLTTPFTSNTGEGRVERGNDVVWTDARNAASGNITAATINVYA